MSDTTKMSLLSRVWGTVDGLMCLSTSGRVQGSGLDNVQLWQYAYRHEGLSFAGSRQEVDELRRLSDAGYLTASTGQTKARKHKLTWTGLMASYPEGHHDEKDFIDMLRYLVDAAAIGPVHGYELCPAAVEYSRNQTDKTAAAYNKELTQAQTVLCVFQSMDWVNVLTDCTGEIWDVFVTPAGHAAAENPPSAGVEVGSMFDFDAWQQGFDDSMKFSKQEPPSCTLNGIPRRLSTGKAWEHIESYKPQEPKSGKASAGKTTSRKKRTGAQKT